MKKLLLLGVLSLAGLGLGTAPASAWFWDHWCGCNCHCTVNITYRPYNAFDPGCTGMSMHGNGCGMFGCMGGQCWVPPPLPSYGGAGYGPCCINSGCCDAGCLPAPEGTPMTAPVAPAAPAAPTAPFTAPMPTPMPATSQMFYYPTNAALNMVQPSGYYPNYYPGYYPGYQPVPPMQGYAMPFNPYGMQAYAR